MSAPQPPTAAPSSPTQYATATRLLSYTLFLSCPVLLLLPPRKLDLYTLSLSAAFVGGLNGVVRDRSGRGILERLRERQAKDGLPTERAREVKERLGRERLLRAQPSGQGMPGALSSSYAPDSTTQEQEEDTGVKGMTKRLWMGNEDSGWKEKRIREEKEALAEGKGYGDLIMDQIWEVWNWGKGKGEGEEG